MRRRRSRRDKAPVKWLWEFSKRVVVIITLLYVVSFLFALAVCFLWTDTATLGTLITEANETFRVVVGGYMVKAGVENAIKIAKNRREGSTEGEGTQDTDGGALG